MNHVNEPTLATVKLSALVFDDAIYPRHTHDPALVQRYADCIEQIEAADARIRVTGPTQPVSGLMSVKNRSSRADRRSCPTSRAFSQGRVRDSGISSTRSGA